MRKDMFEVIIERPRWGSDARIGRKGRRNEKSERALDRAPKYKGMREGGLRKSLNENLAPLIRFLSRRAGRPWDKVRGEICAVISSKSAVQKHVMDHVKQLVEEHVFLVDGAPHIVGAYAGPLLPGYRFRHRFYVCPKTGLLRKVG